MAFYHAHPHLLIIDDSPDYLANPVIQDALRRWRQCMTPDSNMEFACCQDNIEKALAQFSADNDGKHDVTVLLDVYVPERLVVDRAKVVTEFATAALRGSVGPFKPNNMAVKKYNFAQIIKDHLEEHLTETSEIVIVGATPRAAKAAAKKELPFYALGPLLGARLGKGLEALAEEVIAQGCPF